MKTIGLIFLMLISLDSFSQHPFSKMGPKAKNFKHSFSENFKPTMLSVFASPSDKYEAGANAKNRTMDRKEKEKVSYFSDQRIVRGKGANAKNRYNKIAALDKTREAEDSEIKNDSIVPILQK